MNKANSLARKVYHFLRWYNSKIIREQARHDFLNVFKPTLNRITSYVGDVTDKRILDIGCGYFFPQTLLFHSLGAHITGIDASFIIPSTKVTERIRLFGHVSPEEAIHRTIKELRASQVYYRELKRIAGFPLNTSNIDIRQMDVCNSVFEDNTFDAIISNAVFEHIMDLELASHELLRIMKKGASACIEIHLFPSLTGGHTLPYAPAGSDIVETAGIPPWDHLRQQLYSYDQFGLNKLRERDYRTVFESHFRIIEWTSEFWEPKRFLTAGIRKELFDYSEEELLKRSIVVLLQKR